MLSSLEGRKLVERENFQQAADRKDEIMSVVSGILSNQKKIAEYRANIQKLENQIEALKPWMSLDVSMAFRGKKSSVLLVGTIPGVMTLEEIYGLILEHPVQT